MKNSQRFIFLILLFLLNFGCLFVFINKHLHDNNEFNKQINNYLEKCNNIIDSINIDYNDCISFKESYNTIKDSNNNFYLTFNGVMSDISFLCPIMIIIIDSVAIIYVNKIIRNKYISNYYVRTNKNKLLRSILKESYIYIVPIIVAFLINIIYLRLQTNIIGNEYVIQNSWSASTINNFYLFTFLFLMQLTFFLIGYINIGIIMSFKHGNYVLSLITTYLVFISYELIVELLLDRVLKIKYSFYLSIANIFSFDDRLGTFSTLLFPLILLIITLGLIIIKMSNKEKLYLSNEGK